jgi:superfamily II DNA or RNA helicase
MGELIAGSFLNINGFHIKKNNLTKTQIDKIKSCLTVSPRGLSYMGEDVITYKLYKSTENYYTVPRYWGIDNIGIPEKEKFGHHKSKMVFNGELRDYQVDIVNTCNNSLKKYGGGLISVGCGMGKTVMALYIACCLKVKTLVIVHKTFLQDQWIERIKEYTNANIGIIRQKKVDVLGKDIVIGSIQSIAKKDYGKQIFKQFGLVIYDEAHHVSSKYFSKSLLKTGCKYTLALTATPYRLDGLINVMYWFLGACIYKQKEKINKNVVVKKIHYYSDDKDLFTEKKLWRKIGNRGKTLPNTSKMITNLCEITDRVRLQADMIDNIMKNDSSRKILILSNRISHIRDLKRRYDKIVADYIKKGIIEVDEIVTGFFYGDISKAEREETSNYSDVIFGTFEMAQEALDIPRLNTVMFLTPKKDIKQATGRILRKILCQGDVKPMIIDFIDDMSVFTKHGLHRSKYYRRRKFNEEDYYAYNRKICTYKDYMKHRGFESDSDKIQSEIDPVKIFATDPINPDDLQDESSLDSKYDSADDESSDSDMCDRADYIGFKYNIFSP